MIVSRFNYPIFSEAEFLLVSFSSSILEHCVLFGMPVLQVSNWDLLTIFLVCFWFLGMWGFSFYWTSCMT